MLAASVLCWAASHKAHTTGTMRRRLQAAGQSRIGRSQASLMPEAAVRRGESGRPTLKISLCTLKISLCTGAANQAALAAARHALTHLCVDVHVCELGTCRAEMAEGMCRAEMAEGMCRAEMAAPDE